MSRLTFLSNDPRGQSSRRRQSVGTPSTLSPLPPRAPCPRPRATLPPGGAPKRISFDNPALFEESRTRPAPECRAGGGPRRTPAPREGGRRPRRRDLSGYSDARGGERDGSATGARPPCAPPTSAAAAAAQTLKDVQGEDPAQQRRPHRSTLTRRSHRPRRRRRPGPRRRGALLDSIGASRNDRRRHPAAGPSTP